MKDKQPASTPAPEGRLDPTLLENAVGHEFHQGADVESAAADDVVKPIGASRRSATTNVHIAGAGDEETDEGLDPTDEALRHAAEDREDRTAADAVPVFDRGDRIPRV